MIKKILLFSFILGWMHILTSAQHLNIMIDNYDFPEEPSIYVDRTNTDHIIAGSNINHFYFSDDGGYTWEKQNLTSVSHGVWGDPCLITDTAGDFYFFHLSNPPGPAWIDRIVCQKSTDLGETWNDGASIGFVEGKEQDKEWAVVDRTNNNIYVTWTQFDSYGSSNPADSSIIRFSKSTDGGITWSVPVRLSEVAGDCIDDDNTVEGAVPTVGPNGEIYVSWSGPAGIVFDRSFDQGETWLENDIFVTDHVGGWNIEIPGIMRCNGMPVTCCDISGGPNNGTIYINYADIKNGEDDCDVWLVKSTDGGNTWSEPVRVNDDPPGKHQFFTWMDIDQTNGYLYFVFYDRRAYNDNSTDVYMAVSRDGGESFINFKISESPFLPNSGVFFGDYNNISAHDDVIRPIWTRLQDNYLSVWTAIIKPELVGIDDEVSQIPLSLDQNYPNPFNETTYFPFKLKSNSNITLKVFDIWGREVATIISHKNMSQGKYIEQFYAPLYNLKSGVYYFSLIGDNQVVRKKMIFQR